MLLYAGHEFLTLGVHCFVCLLSSSLGFVFHVILHLFFMKVGAVVSYFFSNSMSSCFTALLFDEADLATGYHTGFGGVKVEFFYFLLDDHLHLLLPRFHLSSLCYLLCLFRL